MTASGFASSPDMLGSEYRQGAMRCYMFPDMFSGFTGVSSWKFKIGQESYMRVGLYKALPDEAVMIREKVFIEEQGFKNEFDSADADAEHMVMFENDKPVAACRFYRQADTGDYVIGRIAVLRDYRGRNIGSEMLRAAEDIIRKRGGARALIHAQVRAEAFYEKQGYVCFGQTDLDEDLPHIWMEKIIGL